MIQKLEYDLKKYGFEKDDVDWLNSIIETVNQSSIKYDEELRDFEAFLCKFPSLGFKHKIGCEINNSINQHKHFLLNGFNGEYFRARKVNTDVVFTEKDFNCPPTGKSNFGRFNWEGQRVLYLSESIRGACEEITYSNDNEALVWLSKVKVESGNSKILDLIIDPLNFDGNDNLLEVAILNSGLTRKRPNKNNEKWKPEYLITNYIADCCKEARYDGVLYTSSRYHTQNLALFNYEDFQITFIEEPKIIKYKPDFQQRKLLASFDKE